jgi:hypothetical protein
MRSSRIKTIAVMMVFAFMMFSIPVKGSAEETAPKTKTKEAEVSQGSSKKESGAVHKRHESQWGNIKVSGKKIKPDIPKKYNDLAKSVDAYWNALKARDYKKAYGMENRAYRKKVSLDLYQERHKQTNVAIIAVTPLEVRPLKNEKEVMVKESFRYKAGPIDSVRIMEERWVKERGKWKHILEDKH